MPVDQWFERWADAQINEIKKVDDGAKQRCDELSKLLHEIELELISVSAAVQQIRATIDSIDMELNSTTRQLMDMIRNNADTILKHQTACPHPEVWKDIQNRIVVLEKAEHRREGSGKWEMIIINGIVSVVIAMTIVILTYIISGGRIAS